MLDTVTSVQDMMRRALLEAAGDEAKALEICLSLSKDHPEYVTEIFALALHWLNRQNGQEKRARARRATSVADHRNMTILGAALARPMLEFPLQNGTMLKDAFGVQLDESARQFGLQGQTMLHWSRWLLAVRTKVAEGKTVGECVDELTARTLYEETQHDVLQR